MKSEITELFNSGNGKRADTDICEVLIYNYNLSDTDRNLVEAYLTVKWVA